MEMEMLLEYLTLSFQLKGFLNLFEKRKKKKKINFDELEFPCLQVTFHPHGVA